MLSLSPLVHSAGACKMIIYSVAQLLQFEQERSSRRPVLSAFVGSHWESRQSCLSCLFESVFNSLRTFADKWQHQSVSGNDWHTRSDCHKDVAIFLRFNQNVLDKTDVKASVTAWWKETPFVLLFWSWHPCSLKVETIDHLFKNGGQLKKQLN